MITVRTHTDRHIFNWETDRTSATGPLTKSDAVLLRCPPELLAYLEELEPTLRDPNSEVTTQQPAYARNRYRSLVPEYFVCIGICTRLGCVPTFRPEVVPEDLGDDWLGGYFCPCHGSRFDLAGRLYKGVPAPTNLIVPTHRLRMDNRIVIGESARA